MRSAPSPDSAPPPAPDDQARASGRRDFVVLATGLWLLYAIGFIGLDIALGAPRFLDIFPPLWAAHGLLLTWPLHLAVGAVRPLPVALRWLAIAVAIAVLTLIQVRLDELVVDALFHRIAPPGVGAQLIFRTGRLDPGIDAGPAISFMFYFWVFGCYSIASTLLRSHHRLAAAIAGERRAELTALRLQMNPHFVFNALNSLSTLIMLGRAGEADRMAMRLSTFLRDALTADPARSVTLGDDLASIESYLDIERIRFGDRLITEIDLPDDLADVLLPSFMIQPLVENAVKHGVAQSSEPVTIHIGADRTARGIEVVVSNTLPGPEGPRSDDAPVGTGTGLSNIRHRLKALYGGRAQLTTRKDDGAFSAVLALPEARADEGGSPP